MEAVAELGLEAAVVDHPECSPVGVTGAAGVP
jgi:hypothetical protein